MNLWRLVRNQWDRTAAVAAAVAGAIAILLAWIGVSGHALPAAQLPYIASGAMFGLLLAAAAATLWISADLRDEWHKLDEMHRDIRSLAAFGEAPPSRGEAASGRDEAPSAPDRARSRRDETPSAPDRATSRRDEAPSAPDRARSRRDETPSAGDEARGVPQRRRRRPSTVGQPGR
jgi:hypothetical protein